ncbi:butyrophilin subfamily 3 member A2-like [Channa argus]|uniref:butyrophilin subfamily 3 member A2-like n=1 Tax=Channa argus TaxID=215402 RepID=UPI0029482185|nr:hypothetical protein Q8A73_012674 [Channa argus]
MLSLNYKDSPKHLLISFSALLVLQAVLLLLLTDSCTGQSQDTEPSELITALEGEDVVLPCHLEPATNVVSKSLEWGRLDLEPRFVHVWHEGQTLLVNQNPSYRGRTSLSVEKLEHGDLSLSLSDVKHSDNGRYRCYFPSQGKASTVELLVGSVSSPVIAGLKINSNVVVFQCESKGWYPEPEVLWLEDKGTVLSAGPTETVRGPDDLYTVSSRVTVDKRHSNNIICRVQQNNIDQTRQTHIEVTAECFPAPFCFDTRFSVVLAVSLIFICAAAFFVWKWTQHEIKETKTRQKHETEERERERLLGEKQKKELEEKKAKLNEELQRKEEEEKDMEKVVNTLKHQREELSKLSDQLKCQKEKMEKEKDETDKKVQSVEKENDRYTGLKEIILISKRRLMERKQEHENLQLETSRLVNKTDDVINKMIERKKEVEKLKVDISVKLKKTEEEET